MPLSLAYNGRLSKRCVLLSCFFTAVVLCISFTYAAPSLSREECLSVMYPQSAAFFGSLGTVCAVVFANMGSSYGAAKAGVGVTFLGVQAPEKIMRAIVPVIMAGILGIYGLIIAVIINNNIQTEPNTYSLYAGYLHLGAGLAAGMSSLGAGLAIGIVGDTAARAYGKQEKIFVAMVLMLIFSEALGLYGLIIALLMSNKASRYTNLCASVP